MNNLQFLSHNTFDKLSYKNIIKSHYDISTNTILILNNQAEIYFLKYDPKNSSIQQSCNYTITDIENQQPIFLSYLVENNVALIFTEQGSVLTINQNDGDVQMQAQNQDGITGGSISPDQDSIYIVTKNNTMVMLDSEFQPIKQVMLDEDDQNQNQKCDSFNPKFTWKQDGTFLAINVQTDKGRKCYTRDNQLGLFRSPAKSDIQADGLVQSVSQKSWPNMGHCCAWQPSGGIIAGNDFINSNGKKVNRVIFWEKNSLRHLQFQLFDEITDIIELTWSPDSQILCVQAMNKLSQRVLLMYHRSNYYWYLKYSYLIPQNSHYFLLKNTPSSSLVNQLILLHFEPQPKIQILTYRLEPPKSAFLSEQQQQKIKGCSLFYNIDNNKLFITNFGKNLIPPPMSERQLMINQGWISGVAVCQDKLLIVGNKCVNIYDYSNNCSESYKYKQNCELLTPLINLKFQSFEPLKFSTQNYIFIGNKESKIIQMEKIQEKQKQISYYTYHNQSTGTKITISPSLTSNLDLLLHTNQLTKIIQNCTSYKVYHQFLVFTCSSNSMYDKLYVFDMELDKWLFGETGADSCGDQNVISHKLQEIQQKKQLNYRTIERGSRILTIAKNRLIFQLPRGNLEGIFPKIFMIKWVKKCFEKNLFKQAFQTIRTHKLDLNLLYDLNPRKFSQNSKEILTNIKKSDYINLFVSQLRNEVSSQLRYCLNNNDIDEVQTYVEVKLENKKIQQVCKIVSETLRAADKDKYILSIFTAQIKMGLLQSVLFQIKQMKKDDVETVIPPHILNQEQKAQKKGPKKLSSQDILEYVCWLVDANVIYEASLLTYDIQLASITARCTQMDPKQYIPYLQQLKDMTNQIQFKKKICLDLKKYQKAIQVLAASKDKKYKEEAIQLIRKHKLYKSGLRVFKKSDNITQQQNFLNENYLTQVKMIIVTQLQATGENNQAYNILMACRKFQEALNIAVTLADGKKIKHSIECIKELTEEQKINKVRKIIEQTSQNFKNKSQLAKLYSFINDKQNAAINYLKGGNYQKAYKIMPTLSEEFLDKTFIPNMQLIYSLHKNQLLKDKNMLIQKTNRLHKVHKMKKIQGITFTNKNQMEDDMYSEISMSSRAASSSAYTISTTTGMRKKKDKKRNILTRNVKQGSPLEEEYLIAFINDIKTRAESNIKQSKMLIQHLIYLNLIEEAQNLRDIAREYGKIMNSKPPKFYVQTKFEEQHPEAVFLYGNQVEGKDPKDAEKNKYGIDSFNYLF